MVIAIAGLIMLWGCYWLHRGWPSERFVTRMTVRVSACIVFLTVQTAYLLDVPVIVRSAARIGYAKQSNHAVQCLFMLCMKSFMLLIKLHRFKEPGLLLFQAAKRKGCQRRGGFVWTNWNGCCIRAN